MQHADAMTLDQKRDFYRDGYVILKNVVPQDMVDAAHSRIESRKEGENLAKAQAMTELVNATAVTPILNEAMGRFDPPITAQVGVIPVSNPGKHFNSLGYRDQDMPYYGAQTHWTATSSSGLPAAGVATGAGGASLSAGSSSAPQAGSASSRQAQTARRVAAMVKVNLIMLVLT